MNYQEARVKWQESKEKWETIKKDFPEYESLKKSYLVVCWDYGQIRINELNPLTLSRHIELIKQEDIKERLLILLSEISKLKAQKYMPFYTFIKSVEDIQKKIIDITSKAELVEHWVEVRFNKLDFTGIANIKKHPLVKDSYGIKVML